MRLHQLVEIYMDTKFQCQERKQKKFGCLDHHAVWPGLFCLRLYLFLQWHKIKRKTIKLLFSWNFMTPTDFGIITYKATVCKHIMCTWQRVSEAFSGCSSFLPECKYLTLAEEFSVHWSEWGSKVVSCQVRSHITGDSYKNAAVIKLRPKPLQTYKTTILAVSGTELKCWGISVTAVCSLCRENNRVHKWGQSFVSLFCFH